MSARANTRMEPDRPISTRRLPASGNTALAASALIQAALGVEFTLAGLDKVADPMFVANFDAFVRANPGAANGILAPFVQLLVLPHVAIAATLIKLAELLIGPTLLIGAAEVARRRLSGPLGIQHGYEAVVALIASVAGVGAAGLTLSIFLLEGGVFPTIMPGRAFDTAIPVELLIVPFGISIAWLEFGRFLVLRRPAAVHVVTQIRGPGQP
jgi:hypothetical protein